MKNYEYLIIGGGIAGTTAADILRKNDDNASIAIIEKEPYRSYSRIMLSKPNFFLGKIPFESIWLKKEEWYQENNIDLIKGTQAVEWDSKNRIIKLNDDTELRYDKLLLANGVCARKWTLDVGQKGIFYVRTLDDGKGIIESIKTAKKAVTIGGGFICFEMADLLRESNIEVDMVIREDYYWQSIFDEDAGKILEKALIGGGVNIIHREEVKEVIGEKEVKGVILSDGATVECDLIIIGIGASCEMGWLRDSGLEVDRGIMADEYLKTNINDVWVAGDAAQYNDVILEEVVQMGNWAAAQKQGEIAALNMLGKKQVYKYMTFYTAQGFKTNIAFIGNVRPMEGRHIITRGSVEENSYARIIVDGQRIVGASMINRAKEMGVLGRLIENKLDVSDKYEQLEDSSFDLKTLL